jgi:hypothetical protein
MLAALTVVVGRLPGLHLVDGDPPVNAVLRRVERLQVAWATDATGR